MLALDSPQWAQLAAGSGNNGLVTAKLLRRAAGGDVTAYDELLHELCHQLSVSEVAYVAVPYLVAIAGHLPVLQRPRPLAVVGHVAAARIAYAAAPLVEPWRADYLAANAEALQLATTALARPGWLVSDARRLLSTVAAFHGEVDLALLTFLDADARAISCPACGEAIAFGAR